MARKAKRRAPPQKRHRNVPTVVDPMLEMHKTPPPTPPSFHNILPFVELIIGAEQEVFCLPVDILGDQSESLQASLCQLSPDDRVVCLPDLDPEAFRLFSGWLYSKTFQCTGWNRLIEAYVLGDALDTPMFKDVVMDAIVQEYRRCGKIPYRGIRVFYDCTQDECAGRRFFVDAFLYAEGGDLWVKEGESMLGDKFLADLAAAVLKLARSGGLQPGAAPFEMENCDYHEHVRFEQPCHRRVTEEDEMVVIDPSIELNALLDKPQEVAYPSVVVLPH